MARIQHYRLSSLLAAAAIAMPGAAFAQATTAPSEPEVVAAPAGKEEITVYYHGSIANRDGARPAENPRDAKLPALPVVYDDEPAAPAPAPVKR